jgi:hypothetical protein
MSYIAVKDLKKSHDLWERLKKEHELVLTKDGQAQAIMISIHPDEVDSSLREIRRALFSAAIGRTRSRFAQADAPALQQDVDNAIAESRRTRA